MARYLHLAAVAPDEDTAVRPDIPIKVILADSHSGVRRSLRRLLDREQDVEVVAEGADLSAVMHKVQRHIPHVLVLDLHMPNGSSLEAIRTLRERTPDTEIVAITMEISPAFAQAALAAGAVGFVLKDRSDEELPAAIRAAARGGTYVSPQVAAGLEGLRRATNGDRLSSRESEVLRLIALGYTSAEIAQNLHLSPRTIETHRSHIRDKLGLKTRADLVHYTLGRELLQLPER
jgi:two-component system, NarL family, response regulator NreC